ncbi:uncharacterized protein BP01DRAFT_318650 [Aspergillus saccharolyticus JOP 1030-1]|uniref:LysR family regulatory protein n=1 Tax=Aspergillus saccharolyticus JOP 1030-1 TaxID=1450539 RepID=A0A318ZD87_9EURO|nr:hypothetical protein BP01DRAFT_318650 [Aspergillus saccharolyticus JOP 1030-1]PYH45466.1 hypothetical protein BP01DRAFT_318650 [Aspergillus saccharolyticus JOP 1030-1]
MGLLDLFGKAQPSQPATVSTDTIIPLSFWDGRPYQSGICLEVTYRFDDVLDVQKLDQSLTRLLQLGDWHKLGARLRRNSAGKLEYHIPREYTAQRPGFTLTSEEHPMKACEHPVASRIPAATDNPRVLGTADEILPICRHPQAPQGLDDFIYTDRPQLTVHVVSFTDTTILTVTFLHTLMDGMGMASFFTAWTAVLHGQEDQVPTFLGFDTTPMHILNSNTSAELFVHQGLLLRGFRMLLGIMYFMWDLFWRGPEEQRVLCITGSFVDQLRNQAIRELATTTTADIAKSSDPQAPFISESDVLLAWWTRVVIKALNPAPSRLLCLMNIFDFRSLILPPEHTDPSSNDIAVIGNATFPAYTFLRVGEILTMPISRLAAQIRQSLVRQRTQPQVEALAALIRSTTEANGVDATLFGETNSLLMACSNWHKGRLFEIDFSKAVTSVGEQEYTRTNPVGRPSYLVANASVNGPMPTNLGPVMGKDAGENWWMTWKLPRWAWPMVEAQVNQVGESMIQSGVKRVQ